MPCFAAFAFAVAIPVAAPQDPPVPTAADYERWARAIEPDEQERSYEQIAWRNAFGSAIAEARALGRPVLLWAMNGHPLGCT
jgi:hypothetical protein